MRQMHRPKDYVRCVCGRLVLRTNATKLDGRWYGPECQKRVVMPR